MRIRNRLQGWMVKRGGVASQYQRLVQNATLHSRDAAGLMTDPELSLLWIGTGRGGPMPRGQNDIVRFRFLDCFPGTEP